MGYSTTIDAIKRVENFLNVLKNTDKSQIAWQSADPKRLTYMLHSGLHAAKVIGYEEYAHLKDIWRIRIRANLVIAIKKIEAQPVPQASLLIEGITDVYGIVTYLIANKPTEPVTFTNIELEEGEEIKLTTFCEKEDYLFSIVDNNIHVRKSENDPRTPNT